VGVECGGRVEQAVAVADRRNAQLRQVFRRQPAQDLPVDMLARNAGRYWSSPRPRNHSATSTAISVGAYRMEHYAPPPPRSRMAAESGRLSCAVANGRPIA
jgi:hypothetical protein